MIFRFFKKIVFNVIHWQKIGLFRFVHIGVLFKIFPCPRGIYSKIQTICLYSMKKLCNSSGCEIWPVKHFLESLRVLLSASSTMVTTTNRFSFSILCISTCPCTSCVGLQWRSVSMVTYLGRFHKAPHNLRWCPKVDLSYHSWSVTSICNESTNQEAREKTGSNSFMACAKYWCRVQNAGAVCRWGEVWRDRDPLPGAQGNNSWQARNSSPGAQLVQVDSDHHTRTTSGLWARLLNLNGQNSF